MNMKPIHEERVINTKSLRLEPILRSHARTLFDALQAADLYTFIPTNPPRSIQALEDRYARLAKRQSPGGDEVWLNYAVFSLRHASYVGTVQATLSVEKTYIAYEVFPRYWKQGIAKEACSALIGHLFADYSIDRVAALLDTRNTASWTLLESLGFRRIETIKNADEFKGSVSDEYAYEITKDEWKF